MSRRKEHFLPIESYGIVGNLHTVALVSSLDASIDHFAFPEFDSPLIFGRLLSRRGGGYFQVSPDASHGHWTSKQLYLPSSAVLITKFFGAGGIAQVTDFLPVTRVPEPKHSSIVECLMRRAMENPSGGATPSVGIGQVPHKAKGWPWLIRKVEAVRGTIRFRVRCQPAFDYGRQSHSIRDGNGADCKVFDSKHMVMHLSAHSSALKDDVKPICWSVEEETVTYPTGLEVSMPKLCGDFELSEYQSIFLLLRLPGDGEMENPSVQILEGLFHDTNSFWRSWIEKCSYKGRWRETVERSAMALKMMQYAPTGAIIAAPTTSLPEEVGKEKNWDYRFVWIRDAAFTVYAFLRIGLREEADAFMTWIEKRCVEVVDLDPAGLRLMYDVRGFHPTVTTENGPTCSLLSEEVQLDHWTGYKDSAPVRVGNLAAFQHQLDIYGELMDAIYLCDKWVRPISYDFFVLVRDGIIPHVVKRWREPDHGIWESRDTPQHHVFSKVMAWVAIDRATRLCEKRSLPGPIVEWKQLRSEIYEDVMANGYSKELGVFTQHYGSNKLDASNLIMPLVFFLPPDDPRFVRTLEKTLLPPDLGGLTVNHLVFRYCPGEKAQNNEGTFVLCSFWLVEALTRAGARNPKFLAEARLMFEDILGFANHVGLFSEEIGLVRNSFPLLVFFL